MWTPPLALRFCFLMVVVVWFGLVLFFNCSLVTTEWIEIATLNSLVPLCQESLFLYGPNKILHIIFGLLCDKDV